MRLKKSVKLKHWTRSLVILQFKGLYADTLEAIKVSDKVMLRKFI